MTEVNKEDLRRLAEAATKGQWVSDGDSVNQHGNVVGHYVAHEKGGRIAEAFANCLVRTDAKCRTNAAFIAAARPSAVLSLLDENDQLRAEVEALRSCLRETSGVAITMLYDSHPEDVAAEFTVAELHDVVASSAHLAVGNEKVELIYRNAWDLSKAKEGSAND